MGSKKFFILIAVLMLHFLFCSCVKGESDLLIEISPLDKSIVGLASRIYEESQLLELVKFSGSMNELNTKYPIECLREDNGIFRVSYLGNRSVAVLLFDNLGNSLSGNIYNIQLSKFDLDKLVIGQLLDEVRAIDPDGEYLFLFTGRNDAPKISTHYTKEGYLITIEYDASNVIIRINKELI